MLFMCSEEQIDDEFFLYEENMQHNKWTIFLLVVK